MFAALLEFGWNPILEKENIIGLNKGGKNITLRTWKPNRIIRRKT